MKFWLLWGFDSLVAAVFLYFFFAGLADGSVSSFNLALWLGILAGLGAILGSAAWLKSRGQGMLGVIVLLVLALPSLLALLFLAVVLITAPRWN